MVGHRPLEASILVRVQVRQPNLSTLANTPVGVYDGAMTYLEDPKKQKLIRRLKLIEGQIRGLQNMVEKNTYCVDIITQTSAVKQGLSNVEDLLLENHLGHCLFAQVQAGQTGKIKEEILKVYKLKRK